MKFNSKTIPRASNRTGRYLVDRRRPRRHVVLEHASRGVANLPILADVDVRRREIPSVARPRAVEAPDRVDDAVAARLHEGLGRQIARIIQVVQISLVARHALVVAVVRVDLVQAVLSRSSLLLAELPYSYRCKVQTDFGAGPTRRGPSNFSPIPR